MVAKNRRSRPRAFVTDLFFAGCVSLALISVLELGLHLSGVHLESSLFQMDPVRSYSFRPGASGWSTDENDVFVRVNRFGNRDVERTRDAEPGTLRIAVMGSSTTAGLQVKQEQTYTAVLERRLSRLGARVEVLNFAVPGYATSQDFYTLRDQVWKFHPQIVMEEVSMKLHVVNNTKKLAMPKIDYPYFRLAGDSVVPDESSEKEPRPSSRQIAFSNSMRNFVNSFDLILLAMSARKELGSYGFGKAPTGALVSHDPRSDYWRWTLIPPRFPEIEQGWQILERLLLKMREECDARGAEFWVIASNDAFQINPDPAVAENLRREMREPDLDYGDRRFGHLLEDHGLRHIYLRPDLMAYVNRTKAYLHGGPKMPLGDGHWNALGHRVVAETIAAKLRADSVRFQQWENERTSSVNTSLRNAHNGAATGQP
jgi:hypothetical protein